MTSFTQSIPSISLTPPEGLSQLENLPDPVWNLIVIRTSEPWILRSVSRTVRAHIDRICFFPSCSDGYAIWLVLRPWETLFNAIGKKLELCTTIEEKSSEGMEKVEVIYIATIFTFLQHIRRVCVRKEFGNLWEKSRTSLDLVGMVVEVTSFFFEVLLKKSSRRLFLENDSMFSQCVASVPVFLQVCFVDIVVEIPEGNEGRLCEQRLHQVFSAPLYRQEEKVQHLDLMHKMLRTCLRESEGEKKTQFFLCWIKIVTFLPKFREQIKVAVGCLNLIEEFFVQAECLSDVVEPFFKKLGSLPFKKYCFQESLMRTCIHEWIDSCFSRPEQKNVILEIFTRCFPAGRMGLERGLSEMRIELETSLVEKANEGSIASERMNVTMFLEDVRNQNNSNYSLERYSLGWLLKLAILLQKKLPDDEPMEVHVRKLISAKAKQESEKIEESSLSSSGTLHHLRLSPNGKNRGSAGAT